MDTKAQQLQRFTTRIRQMILRFEELEKENNELYAMVDEKEKEIRALQQKVEALQHDYNSLKLVKMLEITNQDMDTAKQRLAKLIREVNKCITLMSGQQS